MGGKESRGGEIGGGGERRREEENRKYGGSGKFSLNYKLNYLKQPPAATTPRNIPATYQGLKQL